MSVTFIPLEELHFPLMLKWLETPHIKKWWDQDVQSIFQEEASYPQTSQKIWRLLTY